MLTLIKIISIVATTYLGFYLIFEVLVPLIAGFLLWFIIPTLGLSLLVFIGVIMAIIKY